MGSAAETAMCFSGDASMEAVGRSQEALAARPPQSGLKQDMQRQQLDADSDAFVSEHVAFSRCTISARASKLVAVVRILH